MKINWKVRFSNPLWIGQLVLAILTPILAYLGMNLGDLTTWNTLGNVLLDAITNPYLLGLVIVSVFNIINDPTTKGINDSTKAMDYAKPQ